MLDKIMARRKKANEFIEKHKDKEEWEELESTLETLFVAGLAFGALATLLVAGGTFGIAKLKKG